MKRRLSSGLLFGLLLSGCAALPPAPEKAPAPALPADPLAAAQALADEDRLGESLALLDIAIARGRDSTEYRRVREQTLQRKRLLEQDLRDRLLIRRTRAQQDQLPILVKLVQIDPKNRRAAQDLSSIRKHLQRARRQLSGCGARNLEVHPDMAQVCLELALSLETTAADQRLLKRLTEKEKKTEQVKARLEQDIREQQRRQRIDNKLQQARALFQEDQFDASRELLNQILAEAPEHRQARELLAELETKLQAYVANLLETGDRLYREGEIEGAQDVWEAALQLDPQNPVAQEKLQRANRVLENLEDLRRASETKPPAPDP